MPLNEGEPFNLFNFRQTIGDPARPYLFLVHIPEVSNDTVMTTMARSTELPGYQLGEVPIAFQGVNIKIGAPPTFPDWTVTFLCDEAHEMRRIFMRWQHICYDIGTQLLGHSNEYKSDQISVAQLTRNGARATVYGLVGAWPKNVGNISVGHDQTGNVETFEVTFSYDYYVLLNQIGDNTTDTQPGIRSTQAVQIDRGSPPPNGNWQNPFNPQ
jgi:hypothetical protein